MSLLDQELERKRFGDEYQGLSEFHKKVRTINFNFNDDNINGVFEVDNANQLDVDEDAEFEMAHQVYS